MASSVAKTGEAVQNKFDARRILHKCYLAEAPKDGMPAIYTLPLTTIYRNEGKRLEKFEIVLTRIDAHSVTSRQQERLPCTPEKVIMVVGATGTGKTTTINGMINHILGVKWTDNFRFKLINEVSSNQGFEGIGDQTQSQTQYVSTYTLHHVPGFAVPYTITIVDTPGLGDTRGIKQDKRIVDQIRTFFNTRGTQGINHIDAICIMALAGSPRLTPVQRYMFDSVLAMFGKDIRENIFVLFTFADSQKPQARLAMLAAGIVHEGDPFFKFNNCSLYVENPNDDDSFDKMFWKMGILSFDKFFSHLGQTDPKSLVLTKQVLDERAKLEIRVSCLQHNINQRISLLSRLQQEQRILNQHAADISANRNFKYTVYEDQRVARKLEPGTYVTNCMTCNFTCHYPSTISSKEMHRCPAMLDGYCIACPNRCHWTRHVNDQFRYETIQVAVEKEFAVIYRRYNVAVQGHNQLQQVIAELKQEINKVQNVILVYIDEIQRSLKKLSEISLKEDPLQQVDYIDLLIHSEKYEAKPGWEDRVTSFLEIKKMVEQINKTARPGYDPWENYPENNSTPKLFNEALEKLSERFGRFVLS